MEHKPEAAGASPFPEAITETAPALPDEQVRTELRSYLATDSSRVGEAFRLLAEGITAGLLPEQPGKGTGVTWQDWRLLRALLEGNLPTAPTVALAAARRYRAVLRAPGLSESARTYLQVNLDELERRASDPARIGEEAQRASEQTRQAEARNEVGVYVYTLPHYRLHPYDEASGRTLLKVGCSDRDVVTRFRNQVRTTALPEEPILLRIYHATESTAASAEATFHHLLDAADHGRTIGKSAGREWFLTHTRFLDAIATTLGLHIEKFNEDEPDND